MKHIITIIISSFLLITCNGKAQTNKKTLNKFKETPQATALLEQFKKQEHRLEINDCEIIYNGKSFFLGNTLEEIRSILGEPDFEHKNGAMWSKSSVDVRIKNGNVFNIYIYMHEGGYKDVIKPNTNIILVNGVPLTKDMLFGDFLNTSNYSFDDFYIDKYSFYLKPENCELKNIKINFDSKPFYKYSGSGHIRIRGDFDDSQTNPVRKISIFQYDDED